MIEVGEAVMVKCGTADMIADALTKALGPISFVKHMNKLTSYIAPISRDAQPLKMAEEERLKEAMRQLPRDVNSVTTQKSKKWNEVTRAAARTRRNKKNNPNRNRKQFNNKNNRSPPWGW